MIDIRDRALLLRRIPYGDSSLIVHFLTEDHGMLPLMAKGARRLKSPFRPALEPLYELTIAWRSGRTGMGTLVDIERHRLLLPMVSAETGLRLVAMASSLYREGDPHGFTELHRGLRLLDGRPEDSGLAAAVWQMLVDSGWVGDLEHCWSCGEQLSDASTVSWNDGQLCCGQCNSHGMPVFSGMRRGMMAHLVQDNVRLQARDIIAWQRMIDDVLQQHGLRERIGPN